MIIFSLSFSAYVLGAQKKTDMVLLGTYIIYFGGDVRKVYLVGILTFISMIKMINFMLS